MIRVSKKRPCRVCGKSDWCGYSEDEAVSVCMRVESSQPARNGGWVHVGTEARPTVFVPRTKPISKPALFNAPALIEAWTADTSLSALCAHAENLGVSATALAELGACWADPFHAWAFPMRDGSGHTVGIRLRNEDAKKWAVAGSREGLFYPKVLPDDHVAIVCEGPTDTAAALTIGLKAVGRPSCLGAMEPFRSLTRRYRITHLLIISDNDPPRKRPDGGWWQPGLDGAMKLANACGLPFKLIVPPVKDLREWVRSGLTSEAFFALANQQQWRTHGR